MAVSSSVGSMQIDVTPLKRLAADLRAAAPAAAKELRVGLKVAGQIVAAAAKSNAPKAKEPISPSIMVRTAGTSVKVIAGGASAPAAAAFENQGQAGEFWHPVYGNRHAWVTQPARPFLAPAYDDHGEEVETAVTSAIAVALGSAGFGVE